MDWHRSTKTNFPPGEFFLFLFRLKKNCHRFFDGRSFSPKHSFFSPRQLFLIASDGLAIPKKNLGHVSAAAAAFFRWCERVFLSVTSAGRAGRWAGCGSSSVACRPAAEGATRGRPEVAAHAQECPRSVEQVPRIEERKELDWQEDGQTEAQS